MLETALAERSQHFSLWDLDFSCLAKSQGEDNPLFDKDEILRSFNDVGDASKSSNKLLLVTVELVIISLLFKLVVDDKLSKGDKESHFSICNDWFSIGSSVEMLFISLKFALLSFIKIILLIY